MSEDHELRVTLPQDFPTGDAEVIVLEASSDAAQRSRRITVDELFAGRLTPPEGVGPVSLADIDRAIADGASGRGGV